MGTRLGLICLLVSALTLGFGGIALAAPSPQRHAAADAPDLQLFVITFGPGDHPFSKFGHNAVLVLDSATGRNRVYNFGTFSAESPTLISDFLQGRLMYWVSVGDWQHTFAAYAATNRSILAQRLALNARQTRRLVERLERSALPENRYYRYDYYLDNCSTKVRDVLDDALDGQLAKARLAPAEFDWRQHTSRLTADRFWLNLGLNLLLTGGVDTPKTRWEEMFLPSVLAEQLSQIDLADGRPLVDQQELWHEARRPAVASAPPTRGPVLLLVGTMMAVAMTLLGQRARHSRWARAGWTVCLSLLGLVAGTLGCIFAFFWLFTDHHFAHANENLLVLPPWALLLPVVTVKALRGGKAWGVWLRRLGTGLAASSLLGLLLKVLPQFHQDNWMFLALMIPIWGGLAVQLRRLYPPRAVRARANPAELTTSPIPEGRAAVE